VNRTEEPGRPLFTEDARAARRCGEQRREGIDRGGPAWTAGITARLNWTPGFLDPDDEGCAARRPDDAAQLPWRGKLRRVERHRGWQRETGSTPLQANLDTDSSESTRQNLDRTSEHDREERQAGPNPRAARALSGPVGTRPRPERLKRGEPHDRFQGATDLRCAGWSKPPKPGGTARAERVRRVAAPDRRRRRANQKVLADRTEGSSSEQRRRPEWTPSADADGGANFDNPTRGVLT
jgi:hypothetical protein